MRRFRIVSRHMHTSVSRFLCFLSPEAKQPDHTALRGPQVCLEAAKDCRGANRRRGGPKDKLLRRAEHEHLLSALSCAMLAYQSPVCKKQSKAEREIRDKLLRRMAQATRALRVAEAAGFSAPPRQQLLTDECSYKKGTQ